MFFVSYLSLPCYSLFTITWKQILLQDYTEVVLKYSEVFI